MKLFFVLLFATAVVATIRPREEEENPPCFEDSECPGPDGWRCVLDSRQPYSPGECHVIACCKGVGCTERPDLPPCLDLDEELIEEEEESPPVTQKQPPQEERSPVKDKKQQQRKEEHPPCFTDSDCPGPDGWMCGRDSSRPFSPGKCYVHACCQGVGCTERPDLPPCLPLEEREEVELPPTEEEKQQPRKDRHWMAIEAQPDQPKNPSPVKETKQPRKERPRVQEKRPLVQEQKQPRKEEEHPPCFDDSDCPGPDGWRCVRDSRQPYSPGECHVIACCMGNFCAQRPDLGPCTPLDEELPPEEEEEKQQLREERPQIAIEQRVQFQKANLPTKEKKQPQEKNPPCFTESDCPGPTGWMCDRDDKRPFSPGKCFVVACCMDEYCTQRPDLPPCTPLEEERRVPHK